MRKSAWSGCRRRLSSAFWDCLPRTAWAMLRNQDYRTAEVLCEGTMRKFPRCARETYNLSLEQSRADNRTPVIESCELVLGKYPDDGLFLRHRGSPAFTAGVFATAI